MKPENKDIFELNQKIRDAAWDIIKEGYINNDHIDIDDCARVVHPESEDSGSGYWVQAWIYVPKSALED